MRSSVKVPAITFAPTLIVIGDADIVSTDHASRLLSLLGGGVPGDFAGLPKSQLAVLPGTTHIGVLAERTDWLASMLGVGMTFALSSRAPWLLYVVPVLLSLNWFGDSLDGTVARVRNRQRPRYGYYVDHVVDIVGASALFGGLAMCGAMRPAIALLLLVAYVAVMAEVFLATHVTRVFRLASFGFGPTELRIVLSVGAVALVGRPMVPLPWAGAVPLFDVGGAVAVAGLAAAFGVSAVRTAWRLAEEERLA